MNKELMHIYGKRSHLFLLVFMLAACRNVHAPGGPQPLVPALLHCAEEFHAGGLTCLIAEKGRIIHESGGEVPEGPDRTSTQVVLTHFMAPLILDRMLRDSLLHERDSVNKWLKAKDLIFIPADYYERDTGLQDPMTGRILNLIKKKGQTGTYSVTGGFPGKLKFRKDGDRQSLFYNLWRLSDYFDQTYPEYGFPGKDIYNVFPSWYTRGLSGFFGWNILKFQGQTVLWNCFVEGASTILLIKSVEKQVFVALGYPTGRLPSPPDLNRNDLLQSPLAVTLLKSLYLPGADIDYTQPVDSLYALLEKTQGSSYNFIYLHDLQAHARLYDQQGMQAQARALYSVQARLMKDSLLVLYENKPVQAEIGYVSDDLSAVVPFELTKAASVQIFAGGQVRPPHDYSGSTYQFDNVQLFINDHAGEKTNSWLNTHLFQFNYGSNKVRETEAQCAVGDPSDTSYLVEARIAWKTLNPAKHLAGRNLLANVLIGDCDLDESQRKTVLSWTLGPNDGFGDEKKYGRIALVRRPGADNSKLRPGSGNNKVLYAIQTSCPPQIDGKAEELWDRAAWSAVAMPYIGSASRPDNAGRFKALYDDDYLYLLFDVTDNCKNRLGIVTTDKCWIEDAASGLPVWKMNGDTTDAFPGFSDKRRLFLPAGKYLLKYVSDKGHSYEHWYGKPPANGIYGASVYLAAE